MTRLLQTPSLRQPDVTGPLSADEHGAPRPDPPYPQAVSSREPPPELRLYRLLVIVRRGETNVYAQLADELQRFSPRMPSEIIWDRRQAERVLRRAPWPRTGASANAAASPPVPGAWTISGFVVLTTQR